MTRLGEGVANFHEGLVHVLFAGHSTGPDADAEAYAEAARFLAGDDGPDWTLHSCCNRRQIVLCCLIGGYTLIIWFLWRWLIIRPFKILAVFLHELSHAIAAIITCGSVEGMEVHANEGGVTKTVGGSPWCIVPAGYIGSALWGFFFMLCSQSYIASQFASAILGVSLVAVLVIADNNTLRLLCLAFIALLVTFWVLQVEHIFEGLQYLLLFVGTMNGWFAIYDCHDDLISRRVNGSDAVVFAEMTHTSARCWGIIWALFSLGIMTLGVYLSLVIASH